MSGDQLALDGFGELEPDTLFGVPAETPPSAVARVVDADGLERCPACYSELKRGRCSRCERIGADALELAPIVLESSCVTCGAAVRLTRAEMFTVYPITCLAHRD